MLAIGNEELSNAPAIEALIKCPQCGNMHIIEYGQEVLRDGTKKPSKLLAFYTCGAATYLAGIKGKSIIGSLPK